jgi:glycine/D-amino acid oxidase-like deaminating enzyme
MRLAPALALAAPLLLAGCNMEWQRVHTLACRADEQLLARDVLYFGASIPGGGEVSPEAWLQFESDALTPAFPNGYTILPAHGLWRGADGDTAAETSRVVVVIHADTAVAAATLRDVVARYRDRFHQQSVLHEHSVVCARF